MNSSSSSSDDDNFLMIDNIEEAICHFVTNNNLMMQYVIDQQNNQVIHGGSVPGRCFIPRDRKSAHWRLFNDYFSDIPLYNDVMFRRRYRKSRSLFLRVVDEFASHDKYFTHRINRFRRLGLLPLQKVTVVIRMLAYGQPADATDEYVKIRESKAIESLKRFCRAIVEIFSKQYLRSPTSNDVARLLYVNEKRGFPGMLGSLDCMHWKWKNCPTGGLDNLQVVVDHHRLF
ncbi:hypothetical protein L6452_07015 [Arctium lappa]|uniref:Uncharacterized protein n=1 Tax=Arctium lappa TaxID=4217 RepID=A0ACB9EK59_ARCLA|nr:hypothetical protein L6452_07015 [Arctium lappa]